jgi:hypothetical protein
MGKEASATRSVTGGIKLTFQTGLNFASFCEIGIFQELPVTLGKRLFSKNKPFPSGTGSSRKSPLFMKGAEIFEISSRFSHRRGEEVKIAE